jgi:hypothetical protein
VLHSLHTDRQMTCTRRFASDRSSPVRLFACLPLVGILIAHGLLRPIYPLMVHHSTLPSARYGLLRLGAASIACSGALHLLLHPTSTSTCFSTSSIKAGFMTTLSLASHLAIPQSSISRCVIQERQLVRFGLGSTLPYLLPCDVPVGLTPQDLTCLSLHW